MEVGKDIKDKEAISVLQGLIKKGILSRDEDKAVRSAIGILSWTALAESKIAAMRERREKQTRRGT